MGHKTETRPASTLAASGWKAELPTPGDGTGAFSGNPDIYYYPAEAGATNSTQTTVTNGGVAWTADRLDGTQQLSLVEAGKAVGGGTGYFEVPDVPLFDIGRRGFYDHLVGSDLHGNPSFRAR